MKNLKIGLTVCIKDPEEQLWTNGIKLNILKLMHLLNKSENNYDLCLLNTVNVDFSEKKPIYLKDINTYFFNDKFKEMDMIIVIGAQIEYDQMVEFKKIKPENRIVSYRCGNNYVIAMENILFKDGTSKFVYQVEDNFDEIWYIPQQHETNKGFYDTLYRTNSIMVPFVWHQKYLNASLVDSQNAFLNGNFSKGIEYDPTKKQKTIGIMEPNLNIVKFSLIPTMIAEQSYRGKVGSKLIDKVMITNSDQIKEHHEFMGILKSFDLFKDGKFRAESRYQTSYIVTQYFDIVIFHQLLNPLNYVYLDVAYMGYPILHNAPLCKDLGYYYEGNDTTKAAKVLDKILKDHDKNLDKYKEKNEKVLWRYSADNLDIVKEYDMLIENVLKNPGKNSTLVYDEKTNLFKK